MYFPMQSFLVAGISRSGIAAAEYLLENGAKEVLLYDDVSDEGVRAATERLTARGCRALSKEEAFSVCTECDVLVLSPGIPVDHPLPVAFRKAGKAIIGEAELGARALRCPVIAVTGTNGKTTTVSMIEHILSQAGRHAVACGNIGRPLTSCLSELGTEGIAVAEISSFQLETLTSLRPHIAVELNITEDHLNRHYTMDNYIYLKSRLLKNCTESEYAVLNADDPTVRKFAEKTRAKAVFFSTAERKDAGRADTGHTDGGYVEDGAVWFGGERILSLSELPLAGEHNEADALAAVCVCRLMGVRAADIARALKSFRGIPHRIQTIGKVNGVTFIDDSKATNVDAAMRAVESVRGETVLLLGGKDKGYSYEPLFAALKKSDRVVHTVLYGENAFRMLDAAMRERYDRLTLCRPFDLAVRMAYLTARPGQNVLLSPAAASFDAFKSYEERGERFAALMREFAAEKNGQVAGTDGEQTPADEARGGGTTARDAEDAADAEEG